ncbi:hypothetical protein ONE63_005712 [Megalurothrips usitatus]|uniref:Transmembrane protein 60 n=1 Tax=Megalurothrips usitatus TaxID=439358 RepID=A0AAV7XX33_9NEOP|nr:hypothetical protein ONE63_005712 [Megalurothrips usitatus]
MTACHRALFTCFAILVFLILLVLRLDARAEWNWFIVFIPLGIYFLIILFYYMFYIICHCKNGFDFRKQTSMKRKLWSVTSVFLMLTSQFLLCAQIEYPTFSIPTYWVVLPVWIWLVVLSGDIFSRLVRRRRNTPYFYG